MISHVNTRRDGLTFQTLMAFYIKNFDIDLTLVHFNSGIEYLGEIRMVYWRMFTKQQDATGSLRSFLFRTQN